MEIYLIASSFAISNGNTASKKVMESQKKTTKLSNMKKNSYRKIVIANDLSTKSKMTLEN